MNTTNFTLGTTLLAALTFAPVATLADDQSSSAATPVMLERFEVTGTRPQLIESSTLKMAAKVLETPRSVTVLDAARIEQQNFQNADDLLNWIPGMNSNAGSYHFFARGFRMGPSDWKVDGFAGRVVGGSYSPNLFGYEQVVALKGPAGILYGASGQPGGQINLISKKPRTDRSVMLTTRTRSYAGGGVSLGDHAGVEVEFDATGPVSPDGRLLYRFLGSTEHVEELPGSPDENQFYRLALAYPLDADARFTLTPAVEWSRENRGQRSTALSPSSSLSTSDGRTDYRLDDITPVGVNLNAGGRRDDNLTASLALDAALAADWHASAALRYHEREYRNNAYLLQSATLRQADPADSRSWVVSRRHTRAGNDHRNLSFDLNSSYLFRPFDRISSLWQVGLNYHRNATQAYTAQNGAFQSPVNIYTGQAATALVADASADLPRANLTRTSAYNLYVQNQTTINERLIVNLSGGRVGDRTEVVAATGGSSGVTTRSSSVTPNFGLVYLPNRKSSLFASYSTSYTLPDAYYENARGGIGGFQPIEGSSWEVGAKAELWSEVIAASVSLFQTELNRTLVRSDAGDFNPNGNLYYRQVDGGRASQGVELEFTLAPVPTWSTTFTYAYIDAHDRQPDGSAAGPASMTPRHAFSVFSRRAFTTGPLQGWTAQVGLLAQSARWGGQAALNPTTNPDPLRLDSCYRLDAGVSKAWRGWNVAFNIENLTDVAALAGGSTGLNLQWANPRSFTLRVGHRW